MAGPVTIATLLNLHHLRQRATGDGIKIPMGTYLVIRTSVNGCFNSYLGSFLTAYKTLLIGTKSKRLV